MQSNARIFDPHAGSNVMLVASFDDKISWEREKRDLEAERNERDITRIMNQRTGVCG